ncbi:MAG: 4-hydroxy-tetrahydrodipicolinate synthase [Candidatus Bathyarchaeia archaeon]|nr:4-hydroxy-tetrahydrodipicolinate synthase [Candidatus Bathyarchaeota archaeon A05DMB-3]
MKSQNKFEGIIVPHITPFKETGEIDFEALRMCARFWIENGVDGLMPCGSNGEAPYLAREERQKIIATILEEAKGNITVIAGTGAPSTWETIRLTKDAADLGVDAAVVVTPYYFRLSNRELIAHYKAVLEACDLPIILYSVPKFTGYALEPAIISQLAQEYSHVAGVKDSSGNIATITETVRLTSGKIAVLAGTADLVLQTLALGGKGAVIAIANAFPKLCVNLYKACKKGEYQKAAELQHAITHINEVLVKKHNQLSAIKEAMQTLDLPAGYPRKPALPLEETEKTEIKRLVDWTAGLKL